MKTIFLIIFMMVAWFHSPGQKFTYEVTRANGFVSDAIKGTVTIGDSLISMTHVQAKYKVVASTNGITYLTDGVMTHRMSAINAAGMIYYCRKQD